VEGFFCQTVFFLVTKKSNEKSVKNTHYRADCYCLRYYQNCVVFIYHVRSLDFMALIAIPMTHAVMVIESIRGIKYPDVAMSNTSVVVLAMFYC